MNFGEFFFASEFCCRNEENPQEQHRHQQEQSAFVERCSECGQPLVFGRDSSVITCPCCDTDYAPDWSKLQ